MKFLIEILMLMQITNLQIYFVNKTYYLKTKKKITC
jgi:hypothetical protein